MLNSILVIRKMKIKTTIRYNFTPTSSDVSDLKKKKKSLEDVKKLEPWYMLCREAKCCSQCGKQFGDSLNIKIELL